MVKYVVTMGYSVLGHFIHKGYDISAGDVMHMYVTWEDGETVGDAIYGIMILTAINCAFIPYVTCAIYPHLSSTMLSCVYRKHGPLF